MTDQGTDSAGMSPLQRLILDRMRSLGLSPKQVENRGVTHATLHRYMNPVRMSSPPRKAVMQSLANALDLDVARVQRAAVESVGYAYDQESLDATPMTDSVDVLDAIRRDPNLQPAARAHLENQYELLLRLQELDPDLLAAQERRRAAADLHAAADIEHREESLGELAEVDTQSEVRRVSPEEPTPIHGKRPRGPLR